MPGAVTLPQTFMRTGYRVEGAGRIFHHHLASAFHDAASFHDYLPMPWPPDAPMPQAKLNGLPEFGAANTDWRPWPGKEGDVLEVRSVDWCIERLRRTNSAPLFLACGLLRSHMPCFVPQRWPDRYPTKHTAMPVCIENDLDDVPPAGRALQAAEAGKFCKGMMESEKLHPGSYREAVRCYQAAATFADGQIGRLLDALDASFRGKSTISKWYLGDNPDHTPWGRGFQHVLARANVTSGTIDYWDRHAWKLTSQGNEVPARAYGPAAYDFYSTDAIGDYALDFLRHHFGKKDAAPFFLYLAFNAPHFNLAADRKLIETALPGGKHYLGHYAPRQCGRWPSVNTRAIPAAMQSSSAITRPRPKAGGSWATASATNTGGSRSGATANPTRSSRRNFTTSRTIPPKR